MNVRRSIMSTILLVILLIGGGTMLSLSLNHCCEPTHTQQHHCCSCEKHASDCDSHRFALDHKCTSNTTLQLEFTPQGSENRSAKIGSTAAILFTIIVALSTILCSAPSNIEHVEDERIRRLYTLTSRSLRAPPVLA